MFNWSKVGHILIYNKIVLLMNHIEKARIVCVCVCVYMCVGVCMCMFVGDLRKIWIELTIQADQISLQHLILMLATNN